MFYGPYTKQEFYADVLKEWDNPDNKTHGQVVSSLLRGKYSWESLKGHYTKNPYIDTERALYDYHYTFDGTPTMYDHCDGDTARDLFSRIGRHNPAMQNKVTGAIKAMRSRGIHLPPKVNKPEVDFSALRSCSR